MAGEKTVKWSQRKALDRNERLEGCGIDAHGFGKGY